MNKAELEARVAELEAGIVADAAVAVDPVVLAKAKGVLNFSISDVKIALNVLGIEPTLEQKLAIEQAILDNKVEKMSQASTRETAANW